MHDVTTLDLSRIAQDLQIRKVQVEHVVQLLDEGNTVPFITRYRKERTGGLNEDVIRQIQSRVGQQRQLAERKQTILKSIEGQGKLTDELRVAILGADSPKRLEDLYLPYKPKKRTLATVAREKGLEPLAQAICNRDPAVANLDEVLSTLVNPEKELATPADVLAGVQHILAEQVAESADARAVVRAVMWDTGKLATSKNEKLAENQGLDFKDYFQFSEPVRHIPPHRILAINRGEKEGTLKVRLEWNQEVGEQAVLDKLPLADHPHAEFLKTVVKDALTRLLVPSLENEVRRELKEKAENHAVSIFARNLRSLLLQPPLQGYRVLAIDPGFKTGCKVAALDEVGNLLEDAVVFPHPPQKKRADAKARLEDLVRKHHLKVIAIGNGTACRETEEVVAELIAEVSGAPRPETAAEQKVPEVPQQAPEQAQPSEPVAQQTAPDQQPTAPAQVVEEQTQGVPAGPLEYQPGPLPEGTMAAAPAPVQAEAAAPPAPESLVAPPGEQPPIPSPAPETITPVLEKADAPVSMAEAGLNQQPACEVPPEAGQEPGHAEQPALSVVQDQQTREPIPDLAYVIVNEAGASVYSTSGVGKEEFPNYDATLRGTVSIGRRLQDPLSELVKIDPQNIGVGLYQHDVHPRYLKDTLEAVVESSVNHVGVDLNTASVPLLRHVSGLNQLVARELVDYRKQNGPFKNRDQLLQVPNMGPARFVQAAGFLKITGDDPLDQTWIHPESYPAARQLLAELGYAPDALQNKEKKEELDQKLKSLSPEEISTRLQVGVPTIRDILDALARPGRDPREDLPRPIFKKGILKLEDLQPGMELKGTVLNVVDFGAFVDIGLKDSGLVHISQMANRYIKNPYDVLSVGDVVTVWVLSVDQERRRVSLTMIKPGTERKPPEKKPARPRPQRGSRPPRGRRPGPRAGQAPAPGAAPQEQATQPAAAAAVATAPAREPAAAPPPPPPPRPAPHPRKPHRHPPKPKLSKAALEGAAPLRNFRELGAFFEAKEKEEPPPTS